MSELVPTYQRGSWSSLGQLLCLSCGYSCFSDGQMITHLWDLHGLRAVPTKEPVLPLAKPVASPVDKAEAKQP